MAIDVTRYAVKITLLEDMLGTVPKNKNIYTDFIASKVEGRVQQPGKPELDFNDEGDPADESLTIPDANEKSWTGFHTDDEGIFVYDYLVKGFLKEAGNTLKDAVESGKGGKGIKALKSKFDRYVFVYPRRIHIHVPTGGQAAAPTGTLERPLRAMTAQGPRVTLVKSDSVVAGSFLYCEIHLLPQPEINGKLIEEILEYGKYAGLGQFRNGGYGRFEFEMEEMKD